MHQMPRGSLIAGILIATILVSPPTHAQYTADFQTNLISGVTSNWAGDYLVGSNTFADVLLIQNGGSFTNSSSYLGSMTGSSNNNVVVNGSGSVWINKSYLYVGVSGAGNSLVITNGGQVRSGNFPVALGAAYVGSGSTSNTVLVSGSGSAWSIRGPLTIGVSSGQNSLVISNGGQVFNDTRGYIGYNSTSKTNSVRVADGAVWRSDYELHVGERGSSNSLVVAGGTVFVKANLIVGVASSACDNWVQLDGGSVFVTNTAHDAVLEVRRGRFVLNDGLLQVDNLRITTACARFVHNGGTLIVSNLVLDANMDADGDGIPNGWEQTHGLDPLSAGDVTTDSDGDGLSNLQEYLAGTDPTNSASAFRIIGITPEGNDLRITWTVGSGKTSALQRTIGESYWANTFVTIFTVTNTLGSVTNYLDGGAATIASRFYRVRLVQ